jgi:hypothetical protein
MRADYVAFAKRDGVLPVPAGYTAEKQINANAFANIAKPKMERAAPFAGVTLLLTAGAVALRRRRRATRR